MQKLPVFLVLVLAAGCGGGSGDAGANSASSSSSASSSASAGKVVPHERLLELLPALDGWTKAGTPQGTTDPAENVSRVQVSYEPSGADKASQIGIEIMDTSGNANILGPMRESLKAKGPVTTGTAQLPVITEVTQVQGFPALTEWTAEARNGTLSILVADRFTVGITGNYISGIDMLKTVGGAMDLKKLAAMK